MLRCLFLLCLVIVVPPATAQPDTLRTRAERSDFRATSTYDEVMVFVGAIEAEPDFHATTFGTTVEGRELPLVVWGADGFDAEAIQASGKLRVLLMANIHAGEVAGKEAMLMLLREIALGDYAAWADSLTLLFVPIYNADGNEVIDPGNRPYQHGPVDGMGQRPNAQGLDLNRDFVKLDAPESRALVGMIDDYDPHVVIDLHTTNGTVHGYHLTYAPPLHPNTPAMIDSLLREVWLPDVTQSYKERYGWDLMYYGNDKPEWGQPSGWATFDPRPRFGTNYTGLRNRVAILSEAYSYATFEDRVLATLRFVTETLDWAHGHASDIRRTVQQADAESIVGQELFLRSARTWEASPEPGMILLGEVVEEANPHTGEPMLRRTDVQTPTEMPVYGRFRGAESEKAPLAYLLPDTLTTVLDRLDTHGIWHYQSSTFQAPVLVETFQVDSVRIADRPFQQRYEQELFGRYQSTRVRPEPGFIVVPLCQPLARLAFLLLEPRSDSSFSSWGLIGAEAGESYPIRRMTDPMDFISLVPCGVE